MTDAQPRRMADAAYREEVWEQRYADHIKPVNEWIDSLNTPRRWMPYVSPIHSAGAHVLSVMRDPGPATGWGEAFEADDGEVRRGFLSMENDDATAEESLRLVTEVAGLDTHDVAPWSAHPFYLGHDSALTANQIGEGSKYLKMVLTQVMTKVIVVVLQGTEAKKCWASVASRDRRFTEGYKVLHTHNPAARALQRDREDRIKHREDTWRTVGEYLA